MIEHIPELVAAGVDSFKIEGRAKSAYYTAVVTHAYRQGAGRLFCPPVPGLPCAGLGAGGDGKNEPSGLYHRL